MTEQERAANRKKNMPKIRAWEKASIKEYGFFIHVVGNDPASPTGFNAHTHGLNCFKVGDRIIRHYDLQLVYPIPEEMMLTIFHHIVGLIKEGTFFEDGDVSQEVLHDLPVKFVVARECHRDVLRIIMPDKQGCVERGKMTAPYSKQYDDLPKQIKAIVVPHHPQRLLPSKN